MFKTISRHELAIQQLQTSEQFTNGWVPDLHAWTYASATTMTTPGDVTAQYPVGTKIQLTQTTAKYFYAVSASYSAPNTTLTLTGGSDYSLANAAISAVQWSVATSPQGFPQWFNWTPTWTGLTVTGAPSYGGRFAINGRTVTIWVLMNPNGGTYASTSGTTYINNAPITIANVGTGVIAAVAQPSAIGSGVVAMQTNQIYTPTFAANSNWLEMICHCDI